MYDGYSFVVDIDGTLCPVKGKERNTKTFARTRKCWKDCIIIRRMGHALSCLHPGI